MNFEECFSYNKGSVRLHWVQLTLLAKAFFFFTPPTSAHIFLTFSINISSIFTISESKMLFVAIFAANSIRVVMLTNAMLANYLMLEM